MLSRLNLKNAVIYILITIVIGIMGKVLWSQMQVTLNWQKVYDKLGHFGQDCQYTIGPWQENDSFEAIAARPHVLRPITMPYRKNKDITVPNDSFLLVSCQVDLHHLRRDGFAWMQLGNLFDDSAVFVNGQLRLAQSDNEIAEFPLSYTDRQKPMEVMVISKRTNPFNSRPGLASLMPLSYSDNRSDFDMVRWMLSYYRGEGPIFLVAYAFALFSIFMTVWLLGVRYDDVRWMTILSGLFVCEQFSVYAPTSEVSNFADSVNAIAGCGVLLASCAFIYAFLRLKWLTSSLDLIFWNMIAGYAACILFLPATFLSYIGFKWSMPFFIAAIFMLAIGLKGRHLLSQLEGHRRRRVKVILITAFTTAGLYLLQGATQQFTGFVLGSFINMAILTTFAIYLAADLVVFQQQFALEQAKRIDEEKRKELLEERLQLARSVQDLLLPTTTMSNFHCFTYQMFYETAETLAGDWFYTWDINKQERRLLFGDVVGKGPQAAIVVSSIITLLRECEADGLSAAEAIIKLNAGLLNLYDSYMHTTLSMIILKDNGEVDLFNCGSAGWVLVSPGKADYLPMRSTTLGVKKDIEIGSMAMQLPVGSTLLSFSDGLVDGARNLHRLIKTLHEAADSWSLEDYYKAVDEAGNSDRYEDDKTLLVVTRLQ